MNKKGFTLVELLAVIIILAIISGIAMVGVQGVINSSHQKMVETKEKFIREGAIKWGQDNMNMLTSACTVDGNTYPKCNKLQTIDSLIASNYLSTDEVCPVGNENKKCFINNVTKKEMSYTIYVYIKNYRVYSKITKNND